MKKRASIFFIVFTSSLLFSFPFKNGKIDLRGNNTENFSSRGVKLVITADKNRYYSSEDIFIKLKIRNDGFYPVTFYLNKNYLLNFSIVARKPEGKIAQMKDIQYYKNYTDYRDPFYKTYTGSNFHSRVIVLQPSEEFVRTINLKDIIQIDDRENKLLKYNLTAYFYPNPEQNSKLFVKSSNNYDIYIDVKEKNSSNTFSSMQRSSNGMSQDNDSDMNYYYEESNSGLTPREVLYLFLSAEYTRTWKNYFKYVSIKDIIADYPVYARDYMRSNLNEKNMVISKFKKYLVTRKSHKLISFQVLSEKEILHSKNKIAGRHPNKKISMIKAKAVRVIDGFKREFYYTYYLTKINSTWKITGSQAQLIR